MIKQKKDFIKVHDKIRVVKKKQKPPVKKPPVSKNWKPVCNIPLLGPVKPVLPVIKKLKSHYDSSFIDFHWAKKIPQKAIIDSTKKHFGLNHNYYEGDDPYILPDGGVVYCEIQNQKYMAINCFPLFGSEYKKQGTDPDQAKGNAIERAFKNLSEYKLLTINQMFSSYYLFWILY